MPAPAGRLWPCGGQPSALEPRGPRCLHPLPMRAASSLRASTTDAGSSGWEPLGAGREALSWPALSPATLARPDQAPRPPQAGT